ncbi:MAG: alpha-galactosidase [Pirellulaceae bacterium]
MRICVISLLFISAVCMVNMALAVSPSQEEMLRAHRWVTAKFQGGTQEGVRFTTEPPFSFKYGANSSEELFKSWTFEQSQRQLDERRTEHTLTYTDPKTGLLLRCVAVEYHDFPTVEWTLYFKNTGDTDTPVLSDIQALDVNWQRDQGVEFLLHHAVGSPADGSDYGPRETPLGPGMTKRISAAGGRPSNSDLPYFNLQWGGQGVIMVVGWPGQWAAEFARDGGRQMHVRAGQERTHFKLHAEEEVRSPLVVLQFWRGEWIRAQNIWRRWMMTHSMPRPGGKLPPPQFLASSSRAYGEMIGANEQNQIMHIDRYLEEEFKLDYWWMDAGWYIQQKGWPQVGTWEIDPRRFPNGFKPISDHAHSNGIKILVWFEPERVTPGTWLYEKHPEWLLDAPPKRTGPTDGLCERRATKVGGLPCVTHNPTERTLSTVGIQWKPGRLAFHPGPKGEYSVVRWTAPQAGPYAVDAVFLAIDPQATIGGHVLHNGRSLFKGLIHIDGHGNRAAYHQKITVAKGDTLDFVLGYGNGSHAYDSTGLEVTLRNEAGQVHNAAREFNIKRNPNEPWSYGHLPPGPAPKTSAFQLFDDRNVIGDSGWRLLDLGNPAAREWLTRHIDGLIREQGIDLYRQDFNIDPLPYWRSHDTEERQGITEIKHVTGYLAYWDALRRSHPNMLIDSCASGGRRNDLETLRRAVPLWRSDYAFEPVGHQCMTYGISLWIPFHGTGTVACANATYYGSGLTPVEPYAFLSNCAPSLVSAIDIRIKELDYATLRRLVGQWRQISPYYYGDYYPLTSYSRKNDVWMAWQFARPEQGDGVIQVFRRSDSPCDVTRLMLRALDPNARYRLTRLDDSTPTEAVGRELMQTGLQVTIDDRPAAAVITYRKVTGK